MRPALNIMRRLARRYAVLVLACSLVLGLFEFVITAVVATFDVPAMLMGMISFLPQNVRTAMDVIFGGLSPKGLLGFGWDHPIAHTAGISLAVVLGARVVAGEIESGTLELVLAQPVSRSGYMIANIVFAAGTIALLCAAGMLGTLVGFRVFEQDIVEVSALASAATSFGLLLLAFYAITLLASSFTREGGRALGVGVLIAVISFLIRAVALLWRDVAFLEPYSIHTYYEPRHALDTGQLTAGAVTVLLSVTALALLLAMWQFERRDIP